MSIQMGPDTIVGRGGALPQGEEIASFATYAQAQHAVDSLSDEGFPVQLLSIIGTDLRQVERITGRLSWGRAVASGAGSGLWIGVFFALMMNFIGSASTSPMLLGAVLLGVVWGILFQVVGYALTRGRRDFTSISQVVASRYSILAADRVQEAARALADAPGNLSRGGQAACRAEERRRARAESADGPTAFGSRPDEQPRFGVRIQPDGAVSGGGAAATSGASGAAGPAGGTEAGGAARPSGGGTPVPEDHDPYLRR
ncbi:general stress protein [Actinomyces gaoshouyii]|uniref:General stress protein 17M-like domain-containing protein n=1 Tax=Actinomyces gaoshouyii TaxID=1960083 RepID=A0A8H9HCN8_9ACTO|nr:general stress protein [Actinomyces gaoshouyii]ARD42024.1 hypothetical protein B6G06_06455 [Actinomyces gaoshouyii]GGO96846.1 hypothetical protein GCM10011612_08020 [Actinomyces gaoshouyii]